MKKPTSCIVTEHHSASDNYPYYELSSYFIDDLITELNKLRLQSKNKWLYAYITYKGYESRLKSFNLYIQRFQHGDVYDSKDSSKVSEWKSFLKHKIQATAGEL